MTHRFPEGSKLFFASDFHLGAPNEMKSTEREKKLIRWLNSVQSEAAAIFLVGDIFDFWFDYKHVIPRGFSRFQGKIASLTDAGIPIYFFTGNHDMWMFDYFRKELGVQLIRGNIEVEAGNKKMLIGHGDGLGPGDGTYKLLKWVFSNKVCQWLFNWLHPQIGMWIAQSWSRRSRIYNDRNEEKFVSEDNERLLSWCREAEKLQHHDYYIFGHRHLPLDLPVTEHSRYINLGEWIRFNTYAVFDGSTVNLKKYEG